MKPKAGRNFTSGRGGGEGVKGEVKNISLHWLQGIFETVPYESSFHPERDNLSNIYLRAQSNFNDLA